MPTVTESQVIEATLEQIRKRNGFSPVMYLAPTDPIRGQVAGPHVRTTCAVGGVEQAIWKLTGDDNLREARVQVKDDERPESRRRNVVLYSKVMRRLNRVTRSLYPKLANARGEPRYEIETLEHLTICGSERTARGRVVNVLNAALLEIEEEGR